MSGLKLIWEPSIYVVGRQEVVVPELQRFLSSIGAEDWSTDTSNPPEVLCEVAGRVCYTSFNSPRPGGNAAYLGHIVEGGHGSVLEHAVFNIIFAGISRSLSHELVRHRAGFGYSQLSQRFVDGSDVAFVVPPALADDLRSPSLANRGGNWRDCIATALHSYRDQADHLFHKYSGIPDRTARRKAAREAARSVLPNATATVVFATGNARAIRNMLEQRGSLGADAEFRRLACLLASVMKREAPNIFFDVDVATDEHGRDHVAVEHHKV